MNQINFYNFLLALLNLDFVVYFSNSNNNDQIIYTIIFSL